MAARHPLRKFADMLHGRADPHVVIIEIFDLLRILTTIGKLQLHHTAVRHPEQLIVSRINEPDIVIRQRMRV